MPITLLKTLTGAWEKVRGDLFNDLERIEQELNSPVDVTEAIGTISVDVFPTLPEGTLLGRGTGHGTGHTEEIDLGPGLSMSGTVLQVSPDIIASTKRAARLMDEGALRGPRGPQGPQGFLGPMGPRGLRGADGDRGPAGPGFTGFFTGAFTVTRDYIGSTSTDGFVAQNTAPATGAILVQMSPRLRLSGTAWNGASSDVIDAFLELLPQSGTTRGQIKIGMSRNGASTFYPVTIDGNPTTVLANMTLAGDGVYRSSGNGTASSPTFGWVNTGGGSAIGFYTPAANDLNLVCGAANQILWGSGLWRNSANLLMAWSSNADPNLAVADTAMIRAAAAKIKFYNKPEATPDAGFVLDFSVDTVATFRNRADSAYAQVHCLELKTETATFLTRSGVAFTNSAAANVGTLNNAPAAGNPTKWIGIDDNGTTRFIPVW